MRYEREENFQDTLSEDEEQLEGKFEKMEVVEEEDEKMRSKEGFVAYTTKKEKRHQKNRKTKSKEKFKIKRQWNKIKEQMDELGILIDEIDLEKIQNHAQEINRLQEHPNDEAKKGYKEKK